jgi:peptidoglycan/xylan/chitin deacetylase (PgdA/CDA1 family)
VKVPHCRHIVGSIFKTVPPLSLLKVAGVRTLFPYYHMVSDETLDHVRPLYRYRTVAEFKKNIEFLLKTFKPIGMKEIVLKLGVPATFFICSGFLDNKQLGHNQKASLLAVALARHNDRQKTEQVIRILKESHLDAKDVCTGILSIPYIHRWVLDDIAKVLGPESEERLAQCKPYLTSDQIRYLINNGFTIGSHAIDHPLYKDIPLSEQIRQTRDSVNFLAERFNLSYKVFAFPHTDTGVSEDFFAAITRQNQVQASFGTAGMLLDRVPFHIQRFSMEKTNDSAASIVAMNGSRRIFRNLMRNSIIRR